jgi:shikimate dehydrogenase
MTQYQVIGPERRLLTGLVGAPIKHSATPTTHEAAARALGLLCHYHLIEIAGADAAKLRAILDGIRLIGFAGINVTFPYKEAVLPLLDELSPDARAMGAVNTVVVREGRLVGYNTDASGMRRAAQPLVEESERGPVAIVGAGGVGKACAFALASLGVRDIRLFETDAAKALALKASLGERAGVTIAASVAGALEGAAGLFNGTPIGMLPNRDSPVPSRLLHAGLWVADAVYSPLWTPLLIAARAAGARVMTGRDLAVYQGVDAFALFSGREPSATVMGEAFDAVMAARDQLQRDA